MVSAVLSGELRDVKTEKEPFFGIGIPVSCPNVPSEVLKPRTTWKSPDAYDNKAKELAKMFGENFKQFEKDVPGEVKTAGPSA